MTSRLVPPVMMDTDASTMAICKQRLAVVEIGILAHGAVALRLERLALDQQLLEPFAGIGLGGQARLVGAVALELVRRSRCARRRKDPARSRAAAPARRSAGGRRCGGCSWPGRRPRRSRPRCCARWRPWSRFPRRRCRWQARPQARRCRRRSAGRGACWHLSSTVSSNSWNAMTNPPSHDVLRRRIEAPRRQQVLALDRRCRRRESW